MLETRARLKTDMQTRLLFCFSLSTAVKSCLALWLRIETLYRDSLFNVSRTLDAQDTSLYSYQLQWIVGRRWCEEHMWYNLTWQQRPARSMIQQISCLRDSPSCQFHIASSHYSLHIAYRPLPKLIDHCLSHGNNSFFINQWFYRSANCSIAFNPLPN